MAKNIHMAGKASRCRTAASTAGEPAGRAKACGALEAAREAARVAERAFGAWFGRNFATRRAGMIGLRPYARAGALDDIPRGGRAAGRRARGRWYAESYERAVADYVEPMGYVEEAFLREHPLVAVQMAFGLTDVRGLRCYMRGLSREIARMQRRAYRARYYARDNARRRELAAERRRVRRRATLNAAPSPDEFRAAFATAKSSKEARVRFGSMVEDLACHVDSSLRFDADGNVVGRNGGVREWMAENVPELFPKYKTVMRYKALAMRLKQAAEIRDPEPAEKVLPPAGGGDAGPAAAPSDVGGALARVRSAIAEARNTWDGLFAAAEIALDAAEDGGRGPPGRYSSRSSPAW